MNVHKYDNPMNEFLPSIIPICAFRFGWNKISIIEYSDFENPGYMTGWLFTFNTIPVFCHVAGGSENLAAYLANEYAQYLVALGEFDDLEKKMGEDEDVWVLDDDTSIEFNEAFHDAMTDAGFILRTDGGYKRGRWYTIEELLDHVVEIKTSIIVRIADGWDSTCWLNYDANEDTFAYEDAGTEKTTMTRQELLDKYPDEKFTEEDDCDDYPKITKGGNNDRK